jgi:hypothetical protein
MKIISFLAAALFLLPAVPVSAQVVSRITERELIKRDRPYVKVLGANVRGHRHELRALRRFEHRLQTLRLPDDTQVLAIRPGQRPYTLRLVFSNGTRVLNNRDQYGNVTRIRLTDALNDCWNHCWESTGTAAENDNGTGDPEPGLRFYCEDGKRIDPCLMPD